MNNTDNFDDCKINYIKSTYFNNAINGLCVLTYIATNSVCSMILGSRVTNSSNLITVVPLLLVVICNAYLYNKASVQDLPYNITEDGLNKRSKFSRLFNILLRASIFTAMFVSITSLFLVK